MKVTSQDVDGLKTDEIVSENLFTFKFFCHSNWFNIDKLHLY